MEVIGALFDAFKLVLQPELLVYVLAGAVMGIALGILPGLGGIAGMSILIVLLSQFQGTDPMIGIAMAIGMIAVIPTSDTFASVLLGIPGSSSSQATVLDGFPLAKQGKAAQALSSAFASSLFGGILGVIVLTIILATSAGLIKEIRSSTQFLLALFGIALVAILSGRSILKGMLAAGLGLFVAMMGRGEIYGFVDRFLGTEWGWLSAFSDWTATFLPKSVTASNPRGIIQEWQSYLRSGYGVAMVGLSLFAIPEIVGLLRQNKSIAGDAKLGLGWGQGILDWWRNRTISLWNAFIGVVVGIVPGLGGSVVDWIAYGQTKAIVAARGGDVGGFGHGDIRGVIGPESANNAKEGGGLVPTLLLGLPGSGSMAVFLGIMGLFGIEVGASLFDTTVPLAGLNDFGRQWFGETIVITGMVVVFFIAWTLMIGNVFGTSLCFGLSAPISRLTKIPFPVLAPFLFVVIYFAIYKVARTQSFYSLLTLIALGGIGILLKRFKWSRPAFLIGFVLAVPLETKFNSALFQLVRGNMTLVDWVLGAVVVLCIVLVMFYGVVVNRAETKLYVRAGGIRTLSWREKMPNLLFYGLVLAIFAYMFIAPWGWNQWIFSYNGNISDAQMPLFLASVLFPIALLAFARALFNPAEQALYEDEELDARRATSAGGSADHERSLLTAFGWVVGYVALIALVGHLLATPIFCGALLAAYSPLRWWWNLVLVVAATVLLMLLADLVNAKLVVGGIKRAVDLMLLYEVDWAMIAYGRQEVLDANGDAMRVTWLRDIIRFLEKPQLIEPVLEPIWRALTFWLPTRSS